MDFFSHDVKARPIQTYLLSRLSYYGAVRRKIEKNRSEEKSMTFSKLFHRQDKVMCVREIVHGEVTQNNHNNKVAVNAS